MRVAAVSIHLLGYLTDPDDAALAGELARARDSRATRLERMVALMAADGIPLTYDEVLAQVGPGATAGRPHIADALIANGTIRHRDEAFRDWLGDDSPYYVGHYAPTPCAPSSWSARPGACRSSRTRSRAPVRASSTTRSSSRCARPGSSGSRPTTATTGPRRSRAPRRSPSRLGLLLTGSSDYHGAGKLNRLAENTTAPEVLEAIEAASSGATEVLRP